MKTCIAFLLVIFSFSALALPLYTARSGRTCNNCHSSPADWRNPELKKRKCTLSCQGCHVDPTGGGARNVSGVFYSKSTLNRTSPFYEPTEHHGWLYSVRAKPGEDLKAKKKKINDAKNNTNEPLVNPDFKVFDLAYGSPLNGSSEMAFDQDRYNGLNADPLVRFGMDMRFAYWSESRSFFPMQLDTNAFTTPYRHVSLYANAGVLGKIRGLEDTIDRTDLYRLKDLFVLVHQFPYMAYVKAGAFIPPFGTRLDDHTSPIRRDFELNQSITNSRVSGVEIGLAPNYPYLNLAFFEPNRRDSLYVGNDDRDAVVNVFEADGSGMALSAGYRDVAGGGGVSYMTRRRDMEDGGNTNSMSVQWYFNPYFLSASWPLTYMGEYAWGDRQRDISGTVHDHRAIYHELTYLVRKWINLRLKYDFTDADTEIKDDEETRISFGSDLNFTNNMSVSAWVRSSKPTMGDGSALTDSLFYFRAYF